MIDHNTLGKDTTVTSNNNPLRWVRKTEVLVGVERNVAVSSSSPN